MIFYEEAEIIAKEGILELLSKDIKQGDFK